MGKIISIANQKGGVGKTTTSVNISACLALAGKKILLIDADPQGNATSGVGGKKDVEKSTYDLIVHQEEIKNVIRPEMNNTNSFDENFFSTFFRKFVSHFCSKIH